MYSKVYKNLPIGDKEVQIMSIVEFAKETMNATKQLAEKKYAIKEINRVMRITSAILIVSIFLNDELNLGIPFSKITLNLWDEELRDCLKSYFCAVGIFWLGYGLIFSNLLIRICAYCDKSKEVKSFPVLFTVNDLIDFVCSLYFFAYAINMLVEHNNARVNDDMRIYIVAGGYLTFVFANWLYIKNSNNWYNIHRDYTFYYDVNNRKIPEKANVIYRGKLYRVYWSGDVVGRNSNSQKKDWRLMSWGDNESISLEEAVRDREGNLTIETWKNRYE